MNRRVVRTLIAKELFAQMLKGVLLASGERYSSNLPDDAEIYGVRDIDPFTFEVYLVSETFTPVNDDDAIPVFEITFTRHREESVK